MRLGDLDKAEAVLRNIADHLKESGRNDLYPATYAAADVVKQQRTIDPEELRPKGRWILGKVEPGYFTPGGNRPWICSECGEVISWRLDAPKENYCPNCGADMRVR